MGSNSDPLKDIRVIIERIKMRHIGKWVGGADHLMCRNAGHNFTAATLSTLSRWMLLADPLADCSKSLSSENKSKVRAEGILFGRKNQNRAVPKKKFPF